MKVSGINVPKGAQGAGSRRQEQAEGAGKGMSKAGMESMISAGKAMDQAKAYGNAATHLEGQARILQTAGRGREIFWENRKGSAGRKA